MESIDLLRGVTMIIMALVKFPLIDLILVDGNPVKNISDIRRIEITIKDGKIYNPNDLYAAVGVIHFK